MDSCSLIARISTACCNVDRMDRIIAVGRAVLFCFHEIEPPKSLICINLIVSHLRLHILFLLFGIRPPPVSTFPRWQAVSL